MEKAGDCKSTWDMSGLIDSVKQMKRDEKNNNPKSK